MSIDSLREMKNKIILLEEDIKELKKKQELLASLQQDYYNRYFNTQREDFSLLSDIPNNPTHKIHILWDYSVLNVDTIGKIICNYLRKYGDNEVKNYICKRLFKTEISDDIFHSRISYPTLVIGDPEHIYEMDENKNNIVIDYNMLSLIEYPTNNPIIAEKLSGSFRDIKRYSNYSHLVGYVDGLSFETKIYFDFIQELIYSLAYYQKKHDIKMMSANDTWNVYRKIYKK